VNRLLAMAILLAAARPLAAQLDALDTRAGLRRGRSAFPVAVVSTRPHPAVCRIVVPNRDGTSFGTGTLVDVRGSHGLVVTNWHVVHEASGPIEVIFPDGFRSPGHVHKLDQDWDLAALAVWRPSAAPVGIASAVPRQGDSLTIAGYGMGDYRSVTGRCLQFLAPGENQPYDILELGAAARQGDSGGPIFNSRGELAGVLFGEGDGRTCGSHCGRVRQFLAAVLPSSGPSTATLAARPAAPASVHEDPLEAVPGSSLGGALSGAAASSTPAPAALADAAPTGDPLQAPETQSGTPPAPTVIPGPEGNNWVAPAAAAPEPAPLAAAPPPGALLSPTAGPPQPGAAAPAAAGPAWLHSPAVEIARNVLAAVGVLAILGHLLRALFARKPGAPNSG
jgi:hypothetical protein